VRQLLAVLCAVLVSACQGVAPASDDSDLLEPLVPEDDSDLLEPLVPEGADAADRYRVVMTYTARTAIGEFGGVVAVIHEGWVDHADRFEGEVERTDDGRWEGTLDAVATGEDYAAATAIGIGDYTCSGTWEATQPVELTLEVVDAEDAQRMVTDYEEGAVYTEISMRSTGTVEYSDPIDPCDPGGGSGGGDSDLVVPLVPEGDERYAPFGAFSCVHEGMCNIAVRLPPPGYNKVEERIDQSLPEMDSTAEWVVSLEAVD
jgi:hypothetical protein